MSPAGRFVTGTCTEVGKTMVTALLAAAARAEGHAVPAAKPLASGGPPPGEDARLLAAAAGHPPRIHTCLPDPASPDRAARNLGHTLDRGAITAWCRALPGPRLIEGVGGWEVPLAPGWRVSDLAQDLGHPVIVVAANRLGVLSQTLLTVAAVAARGLPVAGVALVDPPAPTPLADWNLADLRRELAVPVLRVPWLADGQPTAARGAPLLSGLWPALARPPAAG